MARGKIHNEVGLANRTIGTAIFKTVPIISTMVLPEMTTA